MSVFKSSDYPAVVRVVQKNSPAHQEKIVEGDIIYAVKTEDEDHLSFEVISHVNGIHPWFYRLNQHYSHIPEAVEADESFVEDLNHRIDNDEIIESCEIVEIAGVTNVKDTLLKDSVTTIKNGVGQQKDSESITIVKKGLEQLKELVTEHGVKKGPGSKRSGESCSIGRKNKKSRSSTESELLEEADDLDVVMNLNQRVKTLQLALDVQNNLMLEKNELIRKQSEEIKQLKTIKLKAVCSDCNQKKREIQIREANVTAKEIKLQEFDKIIAEKSNIIINLESEKVAIVRENNKLSSYNKRISGENPVKSNKSDPLNERKSQNEKVKLTLDLMFSDCRNLFHDDREFQRPPYSYADLVPLALKNTNHGRADFDKLCNFFAFHFPYFNQNTAWKKFLKAELVSSKLFTRVSDGGRVWEWQGAGGTNLRRPSPDNLHASLFESMMRLTKVKRKEILSSMRFPHLLDVIVRGELPRHFPAQSENHEAKAEETSSLFALEKLMVIGESNDNQENVDDPKYVGFNENDLEEDVSVEASEMFILPS